MTFTVRFPDGLEKGIEIKYEQVIMAFTKAGVFGFVKREVNRVRPPKRNIGFLFNCYTALVVTDAIMKLTFGDETKKAKDESEVIKEAEFSEVKESEESKEADDGTK